MAFPPWLIGVLLAVVSAVISNLGLNLQKRNHLNNSASAHAASEKARGEQRSAQQRSHRHRDHHRDHHNAHTAGSAKERERQVSGGGGRRHRVQPSDILIKQAAVGAHAAAASPPPTAAGKQPRKKGGRRRSVRPVLDVHVHGEEAVARASQSKAPGGGYGVLGDSDERGIQELLSASSSYLIQPLPMEPLPLTLPSPQSADASAAVGASPGAPPSHSASAAATAKSVDDAAASIDYTRQLTWQCGLALVILGSLFDFAALAFASQSQIAPLGSLTLVSNVFLAPLLLKETLSRRDVVCTLVIVAGAALAVMCAAHDDGALTVTEMFGYFVHVQFILYAACVFVTVLALRVMTWKAGVLRRRAHSSKEAAQRYVHGMKFHRFGYSAAAGIMGAQSVLFAKCTSTLFRATVSGEGVMFVYPGTYGVLLGLGVTIFFQIRWLNSGLRLFPALYVVPVFQSFWILVSVVSGMVFFDEWQGVLDRPLNAFGFCSGLLLTIGGVYVLSQKAGHERPAGETDEREAEADEALLDAYADSDGLLRRHSLSSTTSSFEPFVHTRSRSLSGDRDFGDDAHAHSASASAAAALKQPLLNEEEEKEGAHAVHLHVAPSRARRGHAGAAGPRLPSPTSAVSSPSVTAAALVPPFLPPAHFHPHYLSPLPENLSPPTSSAGRERGDSDPVDRHRQEERAQSAAAFLSSHRVHVPQRSSLRPPTVEVDSVAVLPSHSFSHANEFLDTPSPAAALRRVRSASIGHVGDDALLAALSKKARARLSKPLSFTAALSALVSPPANVLGPSPHFRRPSWQEISSNAAMNAPGLSAFAHALALRNYERDRDDGERSPSDLSDSDAADAPDSAASESGEGDEDEEEEEEEEEEGKDEDADDAEEVIDDEGLEEEDGEAARKEEKEAPVAGWRPHSDQRRLSPTAATAAAVVSLASSTASPSAGPSPASPASTARPPLTSKHFVRVPATHRQAR